MPIKRRICGGAGWNAEPNGYADENSTWWIGFTALTGEADQVSRSRVTRDRKASIRLSGDVPAG